MPHEKESYLTGLFLKTLPSGKALLSGSVNKSALAEAVRLANDDRLDFTIWLDVASITPKAAAEKRPTKSGNEGPDGSLKIGPAFVPKARPARAEVTADDIPF